MATRRNRKWLGVDRKWGPARTEGGSILLQARAAFSPHKDRRLINLVASLRVPRWPRSAACTRTQHVVNTRVIPRSPCQHALGVFSQPRNLFLQ